MKKSSDAHDDLRAEYDFAKMKGGIRGKYARQARSATNIVLLEPDVAEAFPTEQSVNETLRGVLNTTRAARSTGGLSDTTLRSPSRQKRSTRKAKKPTRAARN